MREISFVNGEYYHVYLRGVDKRRIFDCSGDYQRFVESLYLFNDSKYRHSGDPFEKIAKITGHHLFDIDREQFVSIVSWTLLPNHYHFLLRQEQDGGISKFLHKVNKAYSWSYNHANDRKGTMFEGRFYAKHINNEAYFEYIILYIHLNILDLTGHSWRDGIVTNWFDALNMMDHYPWSSHTFFRGFGQTLPIVNAELANKMFRSTHDYTQALQLWSVRNSYPELIEDIATR